MHSIEVELQYKIHQEFECKEVLSDKTVRKRISEIVIIYDYQHTDIPRISYKLERYNGLFCSNDWWIPDTYSIQPLYGIQPEPYMFNTEIKVLILTIL